MPKRSHRAKHISSAIMAPATIATILVIVAQGIVTPATAAAKNELTRLEAAVAQGEQRCEDEVPAADEDIVTVQGKRYKIISGDAYTCQNGKWTLEGSVLDPTVKHFRIRKVGQKCEVTNTQTNKSRMAGGTEFSSGFEVASFRELFSRDGWNTTALLSPKADDVKKYVQLHNQLMKGGRFRDNRIDIERQNVHTGKSAVRFYSVPPIFPMHTSKSLVEMNKLCFAKGDDLWFSGWFYLEKGMPSTLVDFESRLFRYGAGIRLFIRQKKFATMELKFAHKPSYEQTKVALPRRKWFHIKIHLTLSNHEDGLIEMWQDGTKILSTNGQTLPTHDAIYNAFQVGITATDEETVLLVDDVRVSKDAL